MDTVFIPEIMDEIRTWNHRLNIIADYIISFLRDYGLICTADAE